MNLNEKIKELQADFNEEIFEEVYNAVADIMLFNAKKFKIVGQDTEDNFSILAMELPKAIQKFDADKGVKFSTYFNTICRNRLINEQVAQKDILKEMKDKDISDLYDDLGTTKDVYADITLRIDIMNSNLSDEAKFIVNSIVFEGAKKVDVAKALGVSKGRLSQKIKDIMLELRPLVLA